MAGGAPAEVTAIFAGLALFRAPYTLAVGLVAALTGRLTALVVRVAGRRCAGSAPWSSWPRWWPLRWGLRSAAWLGPPLMSAVFGDGDPAAR